MKKLSMAKNAFLTESDAIKRALELFDEREYDKAVELIAASPRIGSSGCGHSGIVCAHFTHLMRCIGLTASFLSPSEALHGGLGFLKSGDVMVLASRGGKTKELLPIIAFCKKEQVRIIAVTENAESELAKNADALLLMKVTKETDKYNSQGTTSSTVLAVIFHALQAEVIERIGFKNEEFAVIHPNGAVGERLNKNNFEKRSDYGTTF